jgi:chromatin segregation and condensation protein Rec8/ScpA/Scc1 (kleisin family)
LLCLFLAILELVKGRQILAEQPEAFGDIVLCLAPAPPTEGNGRHEPPPAPGQEEPPAGP